MNMKKYFNIVFVMMVCLVLISCKSEAAKSVDNLISELGEITLESEDKIIEAENAVAALAEEDRKQIDNEEILLNARIQYEDLLKTEEAQEVVNVITTIGTVTLDSEKEIKAARKLYDSKDADIQERVSNYSELEAAEEKLSDIKVAEAIKLINEIGTVTLESEKSINAANRAYSSLSASAKNKVNNANILQAAKKEIEGLKAEEKERKKKEAIAKLSVTTDRVAGVTWYQSPNRPKYTNSRCFVLPYIGQNGSSTYMRVLCDYTSDDWIFFESIIFLVDGERYTKSFAYYEIERDNNYGDVWEVADFIPTNSEIEMLKKIADSTETIIRFQGDSSHYDFTVGSKDKQAIRDVITAYELMK